MNIFVTSKDPFECAKFLDDKRVIKMCTETAQLLSTAIRLKTDYSNKDALYKVTHPNHPCNIWARESKQNFEWLLNHHIALCNEYTKRYGKHHKTENMQKYFNECNDLFFDIGLTPFINCAQRLDMNISYKNIPDVFEAYRLYLQERWKFDKRKPTWRKQ